MIAMTWRWSHPFIQGVEAREAASHTTVHRIIPLTKSDPALNVTKAKAEKP